MVTIDTNAIYAARAKAAAMARDEVAAALSQSAINADEIYARRRADLAANRIPSPPASTVS